jgi:hypothetical protein
VRLVEIRRRTPDGEVERLVRVVVAAPGEAAAYEILVSGLPGLEVTMAEGVPDGKGRRLHLADGEAYLDELPRFYHGSRFWAEEVDPEQAT